MPFDLGSIRKIARHTCVGAALLLASAVYCQSFDVLEDLRAVVTATDAYIPSPAQIVAPGRIKAINADPRGRYVLVSQLRRTAGPDIGEANLLLYDSHTGRVKSLWNQPAPEDASPLQGDVRYVRWFPGTDVALVAVGANNIKSGPPTHEPETAGQLILVEPASTRRASRTILDGNCILTKPSRLFGIVIAEVWESDQPHQPRGGHYVTIDAGGRITPLLEADGLTMVSPYMSADGKTVFFDRLRDGTATSANSPAASNYVALDLQTRKLTDANELPQSPHAPVPELPLVLASTQIVARSPASVAAPTRPPLSTLLKPLYLVRNKHFDDKSHLPNSVMIAPHADGSQLLADLSAVLYQTQGTLYTVPLSRMPLPDYGQRVREKAVSSAKSIGIAMSMYAADYDGFLPMSATPTGMSPYVASQSAFNDPSTGAMGFQYLPDGQSQAGIKGADARIAGYLDCLFGRATIYADGHVVWVDAD